MNEEMIVADAMKNGIVTAVTPGAPGTHVGIAKVKVDCAESECKGCKVSMLCSANKDAVTVDAIIPAGMELKVADEVIVVGRVKNWFLGWMLLAGLPCMAILLGVAINYWWKLSEVMAGCICVAFLIIYYCGLYMARKWVNRRVEWVVESKQ